MNLTAAQQIVCDELDAAGTNFNIVVHRNRSINTPEAVAEITAAGARCNAARNAVQNLNI